MAPRKHALLAASAAARWLNCTAAPHFESQFPDSVSEYAAEGTLAHALAECKLRKRYLGTNPRSVAAKLSKLRKDERYNEEMETATDTYLDVVADQVMEYDSQPSVAVEVRVDLSSYVPESFGTCDCCIIGGGVLSILDYKHGKGVPVSAEANPQIMLYALGALDRYQLVYGDTIHTVRMTIVQPRLGSTSTYTLTVEELRAWGDSIRPIAQEAFTGPGSFNPGDWCRFCRGKAQCRARADQYTALEDFKDIQPATLSDAEIGELLERGKALTQWYKDLEAYASEALLQGKPIPGWKMVAGRSVRTWSDQDAAFEAAKAAGYDEALLYERTPLTLSAVEKLMGKAAFAETLGGYVIKPPGKPTLAPESDKRPAYTPAATDFEGVG